MSSKIFSFSLIFLLTSCLNAPVHYKEKSFPISGNNVKEYCKKLEETFSSYNCVKYFESNFKITEKDETIKIQLNKTYLNLVYQSETGENDFLLETYDLLLDEL